MIKTIADIKSFLFKNKSIKQTLFKNTFWITLSTAIGRVLGTILVIYITRTLGATEYGKFAFSLATVSLFVSFLDLGLSSIITREIARNKEEEKEFSAIFSLKILLGLGTVVLISITSFFVTQDQEILTIIRILALFSFLSQFPEIIYAFFYAKQQMEFASLANILQVLLITGFGFFVIFNLPSVKNISYSYLFASLFSLIPLLVFFHFKISPLKLSFKISIWKKFLKMSWPLALTSIFGLVYGYIDSIMLGSSGQITQTGWYNAALKIASFISSPSCIIAASFYPVLSKFNRESKEKFQNAWNHQVKTLILLAFPMVVGSFVLAPQIIGFLYGRDYIPSILVFQILVIMSGLMFLYSAFSQVLIVADQQAKVFLATVLGTLVNIVSNLILIPKFSLYGAAISSVITHFSMFFLYFIFTIRFTSIKALNPALFPILLETLLASVVMYFVISSPRIFYLNIFLSALIGAAVYFSAFFIFKSFLKYSFNYLTIKKNI